MTNPQELAGSAVAGHICICLPPVKMLHFDLIKCVNAPLLSLSSIIPRLRAKCFDEFLIANDIKISFIFLRVLRKKKTMIAPQTSGEELHKSGEPRLTFQLPL